MTWNYRVVHKHIECPDHGETCSLCSDEYGIHEVYYNDDGAPETVTVSPVGPYGNTYEEFIDDMAHYVSALSRPILEYDEICTESFSG